MVARADADLHDLSGLNDLVAGRADDRLAAVAGVDDGLKAVPVAAQRLDNVISNGCDLRFPQTRLNDGKHSARSGAGDLVSDGHAGKFVLALFIAQVGENIRSVNDFGFRGDVLRKHLVDIAGQNVTGGHGTDGFDLLSDIGAQDIGQPLACDALIVFAGNREGVNKMRFEVQTDLLGQQTGFGADKKHRALARSDGAAGLFERRIVAGEICAVAGHLAEPIEEADVNAFFLHTLPDFFVARFIFLQGNGGGQVDLLFVMLEDFCYLLHIFAG